MLSVPLALNLTPVYADPFVQLLKGSAICAKGYSVEGTPVSRVIISEPPDVLTVGGLKPISATT